MGDSPSDSDESGGINITLGKIVAYPISLLLILIGLAGLVTNVVGGILILLSGILGLPIVRAKLKKSQGVSINRWATVGLVFILVVAGGVVIGAGGNGDMGDTGDSGDTTVRTHQMGDSFTVGDEGQSIEYSVQNAYSSSYIMGPVERQEADGQYIILDLSMENVGEESVDITTNHFTIVDSQDRTFDASSEQTLWVESDPRIQVEGVSFEQLQPGVSTEGAVVIEVPEDISEIEFKVEPTGPFSNADEHYVELELEQLEE